MLGERLIIILDNNDYKQCNKRLSKFCEIRNAKTKRNFFRENFAKYASRFLKIFLFRFFSRTFFYLREIFKFLREMPKKIEHFHERKMFHETIFFFFA